MKKNLLLAFALISLSLGCGGDSTSPGDGASIVGTWDLRTINGSPMPFVLTQSATFKDEIVSDVLAMNEDRTGTEVFIERQTTNGVATTDTTTSATTWSQSNAAVTVTFPSDGSAVHGTVSASTFVLAETGITAVYDRR
jgi:hypothetical protein